LFVAVCAASCSAVLVSDLLRRPGFFLSFSDQSGVWESGFRSVEKEKGATRNNGDPIEREVAAQWRADGATFLDIRPSPD
jgi:hypothetical protein